MLPFHFPFDVFRIIRVKSNFSNSSPTFCRKAGTFNIKILNKTNIISIFKNMAIAVFMNNFGVSAGLRPFHGGIIKVNHTKGILRPAL